MTYLDTHAAVWLYAGTVEEFSDAALAEIETAKLVLAPIVLLEIRLLQEIGRITVGPDEIFSALERDLGLKVCDIPFYDVVCAAYEENWTRDPFDRLVVAQAKAGAGKLISRDRRIRANYERCVW